MNESQSQSPQLSQSPQIGETETPPERISGRFVWYAGYLFLKAEEGSISLHDGLTISSIEPGLAEEITTEVLDVAFIGIDHLDFLPEDLKGGRFLAIYKMHPRSIAIPLGNRYLETLLSRALQRTGICRMFTDQPGSQA